MSTEQRYKYMITLLKGQLSSETDDLANISNGAAIIMACMDRLNWVGFYILRDSELVLDHSRGYLLVIE